MNYPTLLLPLDDDPHGAARLALATRLARTWDSRLIGLSCHRPALPADGGMPALHASEPMVLDLLRGRQQAQDREQAFRRRCEASGLASFELRVDADELARAVTHHARSSDLVILGQPDTDDPECAAHRTVVHYVLMHTPRPVLVVPYAGTFEAPGSRVLLAWDDSREAARAASDALPFLRLAGAVHVVTFDTRAAASSNSGAASLAPVVHWLAGHGVAASTAVVPARGDLGNALLSHAADVDADLLVMGAWGTSSLAARVLGGVTRKVMASMTVPVLMSH